VDELKKPLFFVALALLAAAVLLEIGALAFVGSSEVAGDAVGDLLPAGEVQAAFAGLSAEERAQLDNLAAGDKPPGLAIPYLALLDGLLLFTAGLIAASLFLPAGLQARAQGVTTLVFGLLLGLTALAMLAAAIGAVTLMLALLSAVPFGTLTYLATFGFFNRGAAAVTLSFLMLLKLGAGVSLALAQPRFLQNKGLVALLLTAVVANLLVTFLHGLVPGFLVSLTDGIAAVIVAVLALAWLAFLLFGSTMSLYRAIQPPPAVMAEM
jgi:hypothetical protein